MNSLITNLIIIAVILTALAIFTAAASMFPFTKYYLPPAHHQAPAPSTGWPSPAGPADTITPRPKPTLRPPP